MTTIVNKGDWVRGTTVSVGADFMTAYQVREFVRSLDREGVPDDTEITDRHSFETRRFIGLFARVNEVRPGPDTDDGAVTHDAEDT